MEVSTVGSLVGAPVSAVGAAVGTSVGAMVGASVVLENFISNTIVPISVLFPQTQYASSEISDKDAVLHAVGGSEIGPKYANEEDTDSSVINVHDPFASVFVVEYSVES